MEQTAEMPIPSPFTSTAPGRLCLFGEHQDYLDLPVIAAALPLQCRIKVAPTRDCRILEMNIPVLEKTWRCDLDSLPPNAYVNGHADFALAAVLDAISDGWSFICGAQCISTTDIPLQAGCSSSSAFVVAFVQVLARLAGKQDLSPLDIAKRAHHAEVTHFENPGGTMDHVTSALGGTLRIGPGKWDIERLPPLKQCFGLWILADSGEPKDTMAHLKRCKGDRLALLERLGGNWDSDTKHLHLSQDELELLRATRTNRDVEESAATIWSSLSIAEEPATFGTMMNRHHEALRGGLKLSTPRLEAMRRAAIDAGAWGFKLVGSGGGGCAVAWASETLGPVVAKAMKDAGATSTWDIPATTPGIGAGIQED